MSYQLYHSECVVLNSLDVGESDRYIYFLTRELGLVGARAKNIRALESKLRYGMQYLCQANVTLVRGRDSWRLTGAKPGRSFIKTLDKESFLTLSRIFSMIKRMLTGEERNQSLYDDLSTAILFLENNHLSLNKLKSFEYLVLFRVLNNLGYIDNVGPLKNLLSKEFSDEILDIAMENRAKIVDEIRNAIDLSNL